MSNHAHRRRVLSPAQSAVASMLGPLDGQRIPGGCGSCDAFQTVSPKSAGVWSLLVHHDVQCPEYLAMSR